MEWGVYLRKRVVYLYKSLPRVLGLRNFENLVPNKSRTVTFNGFRPHLSKVKHFTTANGVPGPAFLPSVTRAPPASCQPTAAKPRLPGRPSNRPHGPGQTLLRHVTRPDQLPVRRGRLTSSGPASRQGWPAAEEAMAADTERAWGLGPAPSRATSGPTPRCGPSSLRSAPAPSPTAAWEEAEAESRAGRPVRAPARPRVARQLCKEEAESVRGGGACRAWRPPGPRLAARDTPALVSVSGPLPSRVPLRNLPPLLSGRRRSLYPSLPSPPAEGRTAVKPGGVSCTLAARSEPFLFVSGQPPPALHHLPPTVFLAPRPFSDHCFIFPGLYLLVDLLFLPVCQVLRFHHPYIFLLSCSFSFPIFIPLRSLRPPFSFCFRFYPPPPIDCLFVLLFLNSDPSPSAPLRPRRRKSFIFWHLIPQCHWGGGGNYMY